MNARLLFLSTLLTLAPTSTRAMDRDVRAVLITSEYGLIAGTVVGAATLPFTQDIRGLFIGSSAGLYLGIAVGLYYVLDRENPENPLRQRQQPIFQDQNSSLETSHTTLNVADLQRPTLQMQVSVVKF